MKGTPLFFMFSQQSGKIRAGDETRTRDPQLGRLMLYQLSYTRFSNFSNAAIPLQGPETAKRLSYLRSIGENFSWN